MERTKKILAKIDIAKGVGLEIGPLHRPTVSRDQAKIYYADHMSTADLRKKYKGHPFNLDDIVEVDYVVGEKSIARVVGKKKFDYIIASHVIEHVPDTVTWLKDISSILKPGGVLSLVIPDKRYTFDINRQPSRPADVIDAYIHKLRSSTFVMKYDDLSNNQPVNSFDAWNRDIAKPRPIEQIKGALKTAKQEGYVDVHCYTYVPNTFFEIFRHLVVHDLTDFSVEYFRDTAPNEQEFFVTLKKQGNQSRSRQLKSIPKITDEQSRDDGIIALQAELAAVYNSRSWRLSRPLRSTTARARKLRENVKKFIK